MQISDLLNMTKLAVPDGAVLKTLSTDMPSRLLGEKKGWKFIRVLGPFTYLSVHPL